MASNKLYSIRLNQLIDSNKIDNATFAIVYIESQVNKIKLIKKYFGRCKQLDMNSNCKINSNSDLYTLYMVLDHAENLVRSGSVCGIKINKKGLFIPIGK